MYKNYIGEISKCTECDQERRIVVQHPVEKVTVDQSPTHQLLCEDCLKIFLE